MKQKLLYVALFFAFLVGNAFSQVFVDFELDAGGFYDNGWGTGFTSVAQAVDPTSASAGVLALEYNSTGKGDIEKDNVDAAGAQVLTYYIWLPADTPDSLTIKLWAQDNGTWSWTEQAYQSRDIAKEVWYPLNFYMEAYRIDPNVSFDAVNNQIGKMGIEIANWDEHDADTSWSGMIYVDNVSLLGVKPIPLADFETDGNGFYDNGWGAGFTSVGQVADPTSVSAGVLALEYNSTGKGDIEKDAVDPAGGQLLIYNIWLPSDTPDSLTIKLWAQDNGTWSWTEKAYQSREIPKEVWYPLYYDMEAMRVDPNISFDHLNNQIGKMGIEIANWNEHDADTSWTGTIYVDNVSFLGTIVGKKWVFADFDKSAAGLQNFADAHYGDALISISRTDDPTGRTDGVLNSDWNLSLGVKGAFMNSNVNFAWSDTGAVVDTGATSITVDVWLPDGFPMDSTIQLSIYAMDHDTYTWTEDKYIVGSGAFKTNDWNTISFDIMSKVESGDINPFAGANVGIQIYDMLESQTWTGQIYFDNFTLIGAEPPQGALSSPTTMASVETATTRATEYDYAHLTWADNELGTETYRVYISKSPITDLGATGVKRIARDIPHGTEAWNYRPWSTESQEVQLYFAVVAVGSDGEETPLTSECTVGPVTLPTSPSAKAYYVNDFASSFVLDGLDNEFTDYKQYGLQPESAGGTDTTGWDRTSTDMMFNATFVIDDNYLYLSADVTDDDLNADGGSAIVGGQAWEGDALEFYMGFYDATPLDALHGYRDVQSAGTGDYRISFTAWGEVQSASAAYDFPGLEQTVYQKFTGDGYIIEARMALDSLALNNDLTVYNGLMFPLRIDGTDMDPNLDGDSTRSLIVQWGGSGGNAEDWLRPSAWGYLEVINGPVGVGESAANGLPREFKLYAAYPNPFNPSTTIQYDLPKASDIRIDVYNVLGQRVRTLLNGTKNAGTYDLKWNGKNDQGVSQASGIYFVKMHAGNYTKVHKIMFLK